MNRPAALTVPAPSVSDHPGASERERVIWRGVDALLARRPTLAQIEAHRLHLIAVDRHPRFGLPVLPDWLMAYDQSGLRQLTVRALLARIRAVVSGPIVIVKGPELAARYPVPEWRPYSDIDLLVPDPGAARAALERAGFRATMDATRFVDKHHLPPLMLTSLPVPVEIHVDLSWPGWSRPPGVDDLFGHAIWSTSADGYLTLNPVHHAVYVAAHAWNHCPLHTVGDLIDVALAAADLDDQELAAFARECRLERVWRATGATIGAVLTGVDERDATARFFGRDLDRLDVTSYRAYVVRQVLAGLAAPTVASRVGEIARRGAGHLLPAPGEPIRTKARRLVRVTRLGGAPFDAARQGIAGDDLIPAPPRPAPPVPAERPSGGRRFDRRALVDAAEGALWSVLARLLLRFGEIDQVLAWMDRIPSPRARRTGHARLPSTRVFRLAGACLARSAARSQFLRRRRVPHALVIGVHEQLGVFQAHAWIEPTEAPPPGYLELRRIPRIGPE